MNSINKWHKKYSIKEYIFYNSDKIIAWILAPLIIAILFYFDGNSWKWEEISPISMPPFVRIILSAFVYWTFWALLYYLRVYQFLYYFLPAKEFKVIKALIWLWLIGFTYTVVTPFLVLVTNLIIMICYNLLTLLLYIAPPIFFAILIWWLVYMYKKQKRTKKFS